MVRILDRSLEDVIALTGSARGSGVANDHMNALSGLGHIPANVRKIDSRINPRDPHRSRNGDVGRKCRRPEGTLK